VAPNTGAPEEAAAALPLEDAAALPAELEDAAAAGALL
jgi:hypothetical protein